MSSGTGKEGKIVSLGGDPEVGHLGLDMAVTKNSFYFLDLLSYNLVYRFPDLIIRCDHATRVPALSLRIESVIFVIQFLILFSISKDFCLYYHLLLLIYISWSIFILPLPTSFIFNHKCRFILPSLGASSPQGRYASASVEGPA